MWRSTSRANTKASRRSTSTRSTTERLLLEEGWCHHGASALPIEAASLTDDALGSKPRDQLIGGGLEGGLRLAGRDVSERDDIRRLAPVLVVTVDLVACRADAHPVVRFAGGVSTIAREDAAEPCERLAHLHRTRAANATRVLIEGVGKD